MWRLLWVAVSDFQEKTQECLTSWGPRSHAMKPVYSTHKHLCLRITEHFMVLRRHPRQQEPSAISLYGKDRGEEMTDTEARPLNGSCPISSSQRFPNADRVGHWDPHLMYPLLNREILLRIQTLVDRHHLCIRSNPQMRQFLIEGIGVLIIAFVVSAWHKSPFAT